MTILMKSPVGVYISFRFIYLSLIIVLVARPRKEGRLPYHRLDSGCLRFTRSFTSASGHMIAIDADCRAV